METAYEGTKILVIDDQPFIRKVVIAALRQIGISEVFEAADGAEGLVAVRQHLPSAVICDIEMEPIDGLVFLQTLRAEQGSRIPVIFLTQHAESTTVAKARQLGANAFLLKPPSLKALKDRLDHVIHR